MMAGIRMEKQNPEDPLMEEPPYAKQAIEITVGAHRRGAARAGRRRRDDARTGFAG